MFLDRNSLSIVAERSDSGEMYRIDATPDSTLSNASARSMGLNNPFMVTASAIPFFSKLSTWSFISD